MGACSSKAPTPNPYAPRNQTDHTTTPTAHNDVEDVVPENKQSHSASESPFFPFYTRSPAYIFKNSPAETKKSGSKTPLGILQKPFPPPSPAKHIKAVLRRKLSKKSAAIAEAHQDEEAVELDKRFGFSKELTSRLQVGEEVGRGHFGYTCSARYKKGEHKGQRVAMKIIPKSKMTTAISVEDVRREVKILRALSGHSNLVKFYDVFEDCDNVYIVMETKRHQARMTKARANTKNKDYRAKNRIQARNIRGLVHREPTSIDRLNESRTFNKDQRMFLQGEEEQEKLKFDPQF